MPKREELKGIEGWSLTDQRIPVLQAPPSLDYLVDTRIQKFNAPQSHVT